jgi:hypothetical protein
MRQFIGWIRQELPTTTCMTLFAAVILSVSGVAVWQALVLLTLQILIYLAAIVGHEYAHLVSARSLRKAATLHWQPCPAVICADIDRCSAWVIAVAGPFAGALISGGGLSLLIAAIHVTVLLYALPVAIGCMHLAMLLPIFPDGRMAWGKFANVSNERIKV